MKHKTTHRRTVIAAMAVAFAAFADTVDVPSNVTPIANAVISTAVGTAAGSIAAAVKPDSAEVGDLITLRVAVAAEKGARVVPPETEGGFGGFTVLSWKSERKEGRDRDTAFFRYSIAAYRPENCTIPSLTFLAGVDSLYDTLATKEIPVRIIPAIPAGTPDSLLALRDIKPQQKAGRADVRSLWLLLLAALAVLAYFLMEKYAKKKTAAAPAVPLKPPYEEAIELIEALDGKKYLERGEVREYTFELSEIFKRYIGRRYGTIAPELTTEEIVSWLEFSGISREMRLCAEWFFRTSDRVKFAKWHPDRQTVDRFMKEVRVFLEATKPDTELQYELKTQRMGALE